MTITVGGNDHYGRTDGSADDGDDMYPGVTEEEMEGRCADGRRTHSAQRQAGFGVV